MSRSDTRWDNQSAVIGMTELKEQAKALVAHADSTSAMPMVHGYAGQGSVFDRLLEQAVKRV